MLTFCPHRVITGSRPTICASCAFANTGCRCNTWFRLNGAYSRLLPNLVPIRSRCPTAASRVPPALTRQGVWVWRPVLISGMFKAPASRLVAGTFYGLVTAYVSFVRLHIHHIKTDRCQSALMCQRYCVPKHTAEHLFAHRNIKSNRPQHHQLQCIIQRCAWDLLVVPRPLPTMPAGSGGHAGQSRRKTSCRHLSASHAPLRRMQQHATVNLAAQEFFLARKDV